MSETGPVKYPDKMLATAAAEVMWGTDETAGEEYLQVIVDHWLAHSTSVRKFIASSPAGERDLINDILQAIFSEALVVGIKAAVLARVIKDRNSRSPLLS